MYQLYGNIEKFEINIKKDKTCITDESCLAFSALTLLIGW